MIFLGVNRFTVSVNVSAACMVNKDLLMHCDFAYKRDEYTGMWSFIKYRFDTATRENIQFFSVEALHRYIEDTAGIPTNHLERVLPLGSRLKLSEAIQLMHNSRY